MKDKLVCGIGSALIIVVGISFIVLFIFCMAVYPAFAGSILIGIVILAASLMLYELWKYLYEECLRKKGR